MRYRLLLIFLLPFIGDAQVAPVRIPEQQFNFIRHNIDSLNIMLKNGQAELINSRCLLSEHRLCVVRNNEISFSADALLVKGRKKDAYIEMVALKRAALDLYNRKDYQLAVIYWRKALEIAVR